VHDVIIRNGLVVDGTGAPGRRADVAIDGGRVTEIGGVDGTAATEIDATDLVVAPGFVDIHTHYDAQAFWDSTLSPSPLHGVTTVVGGNCGFTIAPLTAGDGPVDPADADYLMRMLARVEGMPLESLQQGLPWDWTSTAEYLDRLDGTLMPNAGFLVGHSALRRVVMHDDATRREATPAELAEMQRLLRAGAGGGRHGLLVDVVAVAQRPHRGRRAVTSRVARRARRAVLGRR
jgi:N-acyl-D-aspartate/D-glutamate deacylase